MILLTAPCGFDPKATPVVGFLTKSNQASIVRNCLFMSSSMEHGSASWLCH